MREWKDERKEKSNSRSRRSNFDACTFGSLRLPGHRKPQATLILGLHCH